MSKKSELEMSNGSELEHLDVFQPSSDATWPSGKFLLEGNSGTEIQSLDVLRSLSVDRKEGSTRRINKNRRSGSDFKFQ